MNVQVGIVILNYKKYEETIDCVKSTLKQKKVDVTIVIIDNGSKNASVKYLEEQFNEDDRVSIISLPENIGYAKGNNVGIKYLRERGIEYICVANSDIIFTTTNILSQMIAANKSRVGIVLPIICNPNGTLDQRVSYKKKYLLMRILKAIFIRQFCFPQKLKFIKSDAAFELSYRDELQTGIQRDHYIVTGSIFLLTPDFFHYYTKLFPETFLYFEEWATILLLYKARLECSIAQTDVIIHKGGASTPDSFEKKQMIAESSRKVARLVFMSQISIAKRY